MLNTVVSQTFSRPSATTVVRSASRGVLVAAVVAAMASVTLALPAAAGGRGPVLDQPDLDWDCPSTICSTTAETGVGLVLDSRTRRPVAGVLLQFRGKGTKSTYSTRTRKDGRYRLTGMTGDGYEVRVVGPRGYESGWVGGIRRYFGRSPHFAHPVVGTWDQAAMVGNVIPRIDLDRRSGA